MLSETSNPSAPSATEPRELESSITDIALVQERLKELANTKVEEVVLPATQVESVEQSGLKHEIFSLLCSGWSPHRISKHLARTESVFIPAIDIRDFLNDIPPAYILEPTYLRRRLLTIDIEIDAVGEMARILRTMEERLAAAVLADEVSPSGSPRVVKLSKEYFTLLERYVITRQKLGELPVVPFKVADVTKQTLAEDAAPRSLHEILESEESENETVEEGLPTSTGSDRPALLPNSSGEKWPI